MNLWFVKIACGYLRSENCFVCQIQFPHCLVQFAIKIYKIKRLLVKTLIFKNHLELVQKLDFHLIFRFLIVLRFVFNPTIQIFNFPPFSQNSNFKIKWLGHQTLIFKINWILCEFQINFIYIQISKHFPRCPYPLGLTLFKIAIQFLFFFKTLIGSYFHICVFIWPI